MPLANRSDVGGADNEPLEGEGPDSSVRPRSDRLGAGSMVTPSVRLVRELSVGGMGSIWLAHHLGLETEVAVKLIAPELIDDDFLERFKREAALSARIRSVHVVKIFDHGVASDGTPYMVMELLEGSTMAEVLEAQGRLDLRTTALIVAQLAKALHAVHVLGIVHRDLKPDNVFLVEDDYELFAKVLDFGIAKQMEAIRHREITRTGMCMGTPGYVAPEQAMNAKGVDHRADLWSLGALAYRALTGMLPFGDGDGDTHEWLVRLFRGDLVPATKLVDGLPPEMDSWFNQALHGVPDKRFPTARAMAEEFVAIVRKASSRIVSPDTLDDEPWAPGEVQAPILEDEDPPSTRPKAWSPITPRAEVEVEPEDPTTFYQRPASSHPPEPAKPQLLVLFVVVLVFVIAGAVAWDSPWSPPTPLSVSPAMDKLAPVLPSAAPVVKPAIIETAEPIATPPPPEPRVLPAKPDKPEPPPIEEAQPPLKIEDPWAE